MNDHHAANYDLMIIRFKWL